MVNTAIDLNYSLNNLSMFYIYVVNLRCWKCEVFTYWNTKFIICNLMTSAHLVWNIIPLYKSDEVCIVKIIGPHIYVHNISRIITIQQGQTDSFMIIFLKILSQRETRKKCSFVSCKVCNIHLLILEKKYLF